MTAQIALMKQLTGQLKKNKDGALKNITSLEKDLFESRKKIGVSGLGCLTRLSKVFLFNAECFSLIILLTLKNIFNTFQ